MVSFSVSSTFFYLLHLYVCCSCRLFFLPFFPCGKDERILETKKNDKLDSNTFLSRVMLHLLYSQYLPVCRSHISLSLVIVIVVRITIVLDFWFDVFLWC